MYYKELKAKLNDAKKKQAEQELKSRLNEKKNLLIRAEKRLKQVEEFNQREEKRKYILRKLSNAFICVFSVSIFITGIIKITFSIVNQGKYIVKKDTSLQEYILSTEIDKKCPNLENFIKNILSEELDGHFPSSYSATKETKECIDYLKSKRFELISVEVDRQNDLYFVMCDFGEKGYFYFKLKPKGERSFDLLSIEPFS